MTLCPLPSSGSCSRRVVTKEEKRGRGAAAQESAGGRRGVKICRAAPGARRPFAAAARPGPIAREGGDVTARGGGGGAGPCSAGCPQLRRGLSRPSSVEPAPGRGLGRCSLGREVTSGGRGPEAGLGPDVAAELGLESEPHGWRGATAERRAPRRPPQPATAAAHDPHWGPMPNRKPPC